MKNCSIIDIEDARQISALVSLQNKIKMFDAGAQGIIGNL